MIVLKMRHYSLLDLISFEMSDIIYNFKPARQLWVDVLKAFLALNVALYHSGSDLTVGESRLWYDISLAFNPMVVPCFYLISGYFLGRSLSRVQARHELKLIYARFRQLIIPGFIFIAMIDADVIRNWYYLNLGGNYFLLSLFLSSAVIILSNHIAGKNEKFKLPLIWVLAICGLLALGLWSKKQWPYLSFNCTMHSMVFVASGYTIALPCKPLVKKCLNRGGVIVALLLYLSVNYMARYGFIDIPDRIWRVINHIIIPFIGIYGVCGCFYILRDKMPNHNRIIRLLSYLGQRSLGLYVLLVVVKHYFNFSILVPSSDYNFINNFILFAAETAVAVITYDILIVTPFVGYFVFGKKRDRAVWEK